MADFSTQQEAFWAGEFGDAYSQRNRGEQLLSANVMMFSRILARTGPIASVIEFGANIGMNLLAFRNLLPSVQLAGVEINPTAVAELAKIPGIAIHNASILELEVTQTYDLSLIKGVLIHIAPDRLSDVYDRLYGASSRFVLVAEYYNPTPVELPYRGHSGKLFKRDFAGEMLDRFPHLKLVDYGFEYHRAAFPQDDITWFLMEKRV